MSEPITLAEPIEWRLWKNRQRRDAIVVSISTFEGRNLIDVRQYFTNEQGQMRPTAKGIALAIDRLPELAKMMDKALRKAIELKLIDDDSEAES